jgi:hypothetical protein
MKKTRLAVLLIIACLPAAGQDQNENLIRLANESGEAMVKGDFARLVELTYPKLVAFAGGREKMIAFLEKDVRESKSQGMEILSMVASNPIQLETVGKETFAIVPIVLRMRVPKGTLLGKSFMIGITENSGKTWTFVSGDSSNPKMMKALFPEAADKLKIPAEERPVLVKP